MIRRFTEADISRETVFDSQAAKGKNTNKLALDKYYTPKDVAEHCFNKFMELYGDKVTEIIEPSAGGGVFLPLFEKRMYMLRLNRQTYQNHENPS